MNEQRRLLVVSGPSGAGKDTVVKYLMEAHPEIEISVSATTRAMRPGEAEGVNYYYMTNAQFEEKLARGEILEHVNYCGKYYGTPKSEVDRRIAAGTTVVLVIEVVGAANIKRMYPESTLVFILPPSMQELERRLRKRGTETEEKIIERTAQAREELKFAENYDYLIVNGALEKAVDDLRAVISAEKLRKVRQMTLLNQLRAE